MFLDASAMVAMLVEETDAASLTRRLEHAVAPCTYACARELDVPVLFKEDDFPLTGITIV
jgi:uncharacterized protein with PIN domain